jgi:hypothetical protein
LKKKKLDSVDAHPDVVQTCSSFRCILGLAFIRVYYETVGGNWGERWCLLPTYHGWVDDLPVICLDSPPFACELYSPTVSPRFLFPEVRQVGVIGVVVSSQKAKARPLWTQDF